MPDTSTAAASRLLRLCEVGVVLLLAVQVALLAVRLAEPQGPLGRPVPAILKDPVPVPGGFDPFAVDAASIGTATTRTGDWKLFGLRAASDGGSAILQSGEGRQVAYRAGDRIAAGLVLDRVAPDHVLLRTPTGVQRLEPAARAAGHAGQAASGAAAMPAVVDPVPSAPVAADPAGLLAAAGLQPRQQDGQVSGYLFTAQGDDPLLRQAGLRPGDVLLSVNGLAAGPEGLQELMQGQGGTPRQATLTFERDGQVHRLTLEEPHP